jgi:hypothetical protein
MSMFRYVSATSIVLVGLGLMALPAKAQQPLDQQLDFGNVSDGAFAEPPDLPDGDIENLDHFNGYPPPERAGALPPPDHLYAEAPAGKARGKLHKR